MSEAPQWVLVPVEPTTDMERAFFNACDENGMCLWRSAWRALLEARPKRQLSRDGVAKQERLGDQT